MRTAVIIPVFNEGERVVPVVEASLAANSVAEVIVVDDGSTDKTAEILTSQRDIKVLTHSRNLGKFAALDTGVKFIRSAGYDTAVFLDGDLRDLAAAHIEQLTAPLADERVPMVIGYLGLRKTLVKKAILQHWGALSGQRALRLEVWDLLSDKDKHGYDEAALNARLRKQKMHHNIVRMPLEGVSHVGKTEKSQRYQKPCRRI